MHAKDALQALVRSVPSGAVAAGQLQLEQEACSVVVSCATRKVPELKGMANGRAFLLAAIRTILMTG